MSQRLANAFGLAAIDVPEKEFIGACGRNLSAGQDTAAIVLVQSFEPGGNVHIVAESPCSRSIRRSDIA